MVAALLVGCGGEDRLTKAEYEQKVRSVYAGVQEAFQATAGGQADLADRIERAQKELRNAAADLDESEPPKEVEEQNEQLVDGMREYARDLDELREAAERVDLRAVEKFNDRLPENEAIKRMAEAAEEMKFKGYDLGAIAEE